VGGKKEERVKCKITKLSRVRSFGMFGKGDIQKSFLRTNTSCPMICQMDNIRNAQGGFSTLERLLSIYFVQDL